MLLSGVLLSGAPDSSNAPGAIRDTLKMAVVTAGRGICVSREDVLETRKALTVADLLLQSPGLVVADYGGFAGIRSVNLRGLGSPMTTVHIDGIKVGNVQSGQPDLAMLGLENFSGAVVDYAQNSIDFNTSRPFFGDDRRGLCGTSRKGKSAAGKIGATAASFGTMAVNGRADFRLSDKVALSVNAAGMKTDGDFPYPGGEAAAGAMEEKRRENNDMKQARAGLDVFGTMQGGDWMAKAYYNGSDRGTPGTVDWPSADRQTDRNAFAQGLVRKRFSPLYSLDVSGKLAYDDVLYESGWGDSRYGQTELQLNTAQKFDVRPWLDLSAVAEYQWDGLKATIYDAARNDVTLIGGAAVKLPRFKADVTVQYEGILDVSDQDSPTASVLSPSADFRWSVTERLDVIGFARRAYRMPTFNELYYPGFGNPELKPEDAILTDVGVDWSRSGGAAVRRTVKLKVDAFYNHLTDKIVSAPSPDDPALWLPYNISKVRAKGVDAEGGVRFASGTDADLWSAGLVARYSFQDAADVPFLSRHTVVLTADASFRALSLNAVWNYRGGRHDSAGPIPDWNTLDLILAASLSGMTIKLACRNIADSRYELVAGYPMPGRNAALSIELRF